MSGWIKFEKDMAHDPRLLEIAVQLAEDAHLSSGNRDLSNQEAVALYCNALRGALVTLWCYADTHINDDDTLEMGAGAVEALVGIEGFCDLMPKEWITVTDSGAVKLPGYCSKNGVISRRKRTQDSNDRVRRFREKRNAARNALPAHMKRSGNARVTAEDLDLDLDLDLKKKNPPAPEAPTSTKVSRVAVPPDWLLDFKLAYPERAGDQGWRKAQRAAHARISEGHTPSEMIEGARRYAVFCEAQGKTGSEYVKQACTFLGPDKPFLLPWTLPPTKAQVRQDKNISASEQWLREQESSDAA